MATKARESTKSRGMNAALPRVLELEREGFPVYYVPLDESTFVKGHGYRACIVFAGENGYRPTGNWPYSGGAGQVMPYFWGPSLEDALARARDLNESNGVTKDEEDLIVLRSMSRSKSIRGVGRV